MRISLIIATPDKDYAEHLAGYLSDKYQESFEVTVCIESEQLKAAQASRVFDAALIGSEMASVVDLTGIKLPLLLWSDTDEEKSAGQDGVGSVLNTLGVTEDILSSLGKIEKYQRISRISSDVHEAFAKSASSSTSAFASGAARITAVWSPSGGSGKTSVALAYAAKLASNGGDVIYFGFEHFSTIPVYFGETGKSVSSVFENLDRNVSQLLKAIAIKDSGSGITYFTQPDNYDGMNNLTVEDFDILISELSKNAPQLVLDLPSVCDGRCRLAMEKADEIFIVANANPASAAKINQFVTQHNFFEKIKDRGILIANKGAKISFDRFKLTVNLPLVNSSDPVSVYKTLSGVNFY